MTAPLLEVPMTEARAKFESARKRADAAIARLDGDGDKPRRPQKASPLSTITTPT